MNRNKLLKQIKDTYSEDGNGLKKLKRQKIIALLIGGVFMAIVFRLDIFNFENILGVFAFILVNAFLVAIYANLNSSIHTYDVVKEVIDFKKIDEILEQENNPSDKS